MRKETELAHLEVALADAAVALLVVGPVAVVARQDITGEYAVSMQYGAEPPRPMQRFSSLADLMAYIGGGVVPGVRGDEDGWMPMATVYGPP